MPLIARWRHLPREARDTLFLLAVIAWTVLPHVPRLPLWCSLLVAGVLVWRGRIALANTALPSRWVIFGVLLVAGGLTLYSHRSLLGREAGTTLIVALMALKTLELRARRDAFVVFFLGFFIVLTQFLGSQSLLVAGAMLVSVWGLLTALVLAHMPVGRPRLSQAAGLAARAALLGAPVMVALFMLFPRVGPLWGVPQDRSASTGLSSRMEMGSVARLALDDGIALRLRFDGAPPPLSAMYLRGPVLTHFDGREWRRGNTGFRAGDQPRVPLQVAGPGLEYELTLEPHRSDVLPLLEAANEAPRAELSEDEPAAQRFFRRDDLQWQAQRPIGERMRLRASAHLDFRYGPANADDFSLREALALPPEHNPRTRAWAAALRAEPRYAQADADALAGAVMRHIRSGGFSYTLEPGTYGDERGFHAIDEFWLDRKEGFCEHFAAAFVVVMRALEVPARIVTGYQGADPTPVDGYVVVRNSHAHAWAEYWRPGRGWVRADPTGAVSPDRIGLGLNLAPAPGLVAGAIGSVSPTLLVELRRNWEALNNRWNQWVLGFSRGQQLDLLRNLGFESPSWSDLAFLLIALVSSACLAAAGWAWWDRQRQDPWQRLAARLRARLLRLGLESHPHDPPRRLARTLRERLGSPAQALAALLDELDRRRYGPEGARLPPAAWVRAFDAEARRLGQALRQAPQAPAAPQGASDAQP